VRLVLDSGIEHLHAEELKMNKIKRPEREVSYFLEGKKWVLISEVVRTASSVCIKHNKGGSHSHSDRDYW
jgi:hypothetical protein